MASITTALPTVNNSASLKSDMDTLGATVRKLRRDHGWSQEHLAELIGASQRWISNLEADGVRMPRIQRLRKLAEALGVDPGVLVKAAQYTQSLELGREIATSAPDELPAHLRTSFHKLEELTPERQRRIIEMIEEQSILDEMERERLKRDT
jgi:transcriptional regulator with XRE-family HTH domain